MSATFSVETDLSRVWRVADKVVVTDEGALSDHELADWLVLL